MGGDVGKVQEAVEFVPFDGCLLSYTLCDAVLVCPFGSQILAGSRHDGRGDGRIAVQTPAQGCGSARLTPVDCDGFYADRRYPLCNLCKLRPKKEGRTEKALLGCRVQSADTGRREGKMTVEARIFLPLTRFGCATATK
jgi:hypothetical protein